MLLAVIELASTVFPEILTGIERKHTSFVKFQVGSACYGHAFSRNNIFIRMVYTSVIYPDSCVNHVIIAGEGVPLTSAANLN